ncbi:MAG: photosystem reaction center subunit H [Verrucomicrobiales bacterium VVV1]|nr:MAG: photosystem reaction center subunit H [Verrucomicrobiales bacterium VVV1]
MIQNLNDLFGHKLAATDGEIGHLKDAYFDDESWAVRYLIAETGSWLSGFQVLLSPHSFSHFEHDAKTLHVNLTRNKIEHSPKIESHRPVSRQYEEEYYGYYGWPAYWDGGAIWGQGAYPIILPNSTQEMEAHLQVHHKHDDPHLRSIKAVTNYDIEATDGAIGHVTGFHVDDHPWIIRDLLVTAGLWFMGKDVLIPTASVDRIDHEESRVHVNLSMADIRQTAENAIVQPHALAASEA